MKETFGVYGTVEEAAVSRAQKFRESSVSAGKPGSRLVSLDSANSHREVGEKRNKAVNPSESDSGDEFYITYGPTFPHKSANS